MAHTAAIVDELLGVYDEAMALVAEFIRVGADLRSQVQGELPQPVFQRPMPR